jgi:hypothetical protein
MINLSLIARHLERDRLVEAELRTAVEGEELAAVQYEINPVMVWPARSPTVRVTLSRWNSEDSGVEPCLFTLRVEPQACCESVHYSLLFA